ncbi:MAG: class I SAM-dependent methyltransferase [Deltaproteobacteria bacterium]|nr:class I SAM-dependent methyltransferase [Deltaproteobacteria bacterium]
MMIIPKWQYDETKTQGVDYTTAEVVAAYDRMHRKFRDYAKSSEIILQRLGLDSSSIVIDLGAGTGAFALHAAKTCRTVYAVDISTEMLNYCRQQAERDGLENIVFCHGGLLTYEHSAEPADAIVCVAVLHHLPDFWKSAALKRCRAMLKPKGKLFLFDIVFPSSTNDIQLKIAQWVQACESMSEARLAEEAVIHVKDEFSTYDWIMEGLLRRSGFQIDTAEYGKGFQTTYVCTLS